MGAPGWKASSVAPLIVEVETSPGSGVFVADERLRADEITAGSDGDIASATVAVRLDNDFGMSAARDAYPPDRRLVIRTDHPDPARREPLFDGFPQVQEARWDGHSRSTGETYVLRAVGAYEVLSRDARAWIYGRRMRNGQIEDGLGTDPATWQSRSVLVEALPCVFNLNGQPNCAATPLTVTAPDGSARAVHVFTYEGDPQAVRWTYLRVLRYLVWFHRPREGPVDEGNVFSATDALVEFDGDTGSGGVPESGLLRSLAALADSLNGEATNLVEALALLAEACGVHVTPRVVNREGRVRTELDVWSAGDAPARPLALAWGGRHRDGTPRFDASGAAAVDLFAANEVSEAVVRWDRRRLVNAPIVIGDVRKYEMTVPLVPGWPPTENLDNVAPEDRATAKAMALTPNLVEYLGDDAELYEWYRRYHRSGSEFSSYRDVSRLWVLNDDGRFDGATYNRNAPFDDYRPFDFSTVADTTVTTPGGWTRRTRALQKALTHTEDGQEFGVYVEISFDGGQTWSRPQGSVSVRSDPTGVYFGIANPTSIRPPGSTPEEQNLWYAIIDQTFRVRVTAVFDADERLSVRRPPDDTETPTLRVSARVVRRPGRYRFSSRRGTADALADVNPDATDIGQDDSLLLLLDAERIARAERGGRVLVTPAIPWLETDIAIGTRVPVVRGRGLSLQNRCEREASGPVVIGKRYRLSGGHYETELVLEAG